MPVTASKTILVSPLDWGLGHTTRCVPLIEHLQQLGCMVLFAGNSAQQQYIKKTFPDIKLLHLDGYDVKYSRSGSGFIFAMLKQMQKLLRRIRYEHDWLIEQTAIHQIDGIISDNRYGLFDPGKPSVILTHQLSVRTGMGSAADNILRKLHYKYLNRFDECWIVDAKKDDGISGALAHPPTLPENTKYIGLLSQLQGQKTIDGNKLVVLLSGPEPQRTILSKAIWQQIQDSDTEVVFIEGSNDACTPQHIPPHVSYHKRLTKNELLPILADAKMIVSRSGYSTVMDMQALGKKAIMIPTPGQTEQEYLARYLHEKGIFYSAKQKNFDLKTALKEAANFPYKLPIQQDSFEQYKPVLKNWVASL